MKTFELTTPVSFPDLCTWWRRDKESLVKALVDKAVDCYVPISVDRETGSGAYRKLEAITKDHFESIRFDMDDIDLMFLADTMEAKARSNETITVGQIRALLHREPDVSEWRKSIATAVKIMDYYLQPGNEWPMAKNHKAEWKELIGQWNEEAGVEAYRLHDKAREELWRCAKEVKAVTCKTWRKAPPKK
ncbi:MAG: hypothetical protein EOM03_16940 [Clostridia bacterium]|nr:hypothetical protein [Clostridia bacterium]